MDCIGEIQFWISIVIIDDNTMDVSNVKHRLNRVRRFASMATVATRFQSRQRGRKVRNTWTKSNENKNRKIVLLNSFVFVDLELLLWNFNSQLEVIWLAHQVTSCHIPRGVEIPFVNVIELTFVNLSNCCWKEIPMNSIEYRSIDEQAQKVMCGKRWEVVSSQSTLNWYCFNYLIEIN